MHAAQRDAKLVGDPRRELGVRPPADQHQPLVVVPPEDARGGARLDDAHRAWKSTPGAGRELDISSPACDLAGPSPGPSPRGPSSPGSSPRGSSSPGPSLPGSSPPGPSPPPRGLRPPSPGPSALSSGA